MGVNNVANFPFKEVCCALLALFMTTVYKNKRASDKRTVELISIEPLI